MDLDINHDLQLDKVNIAIFGAAVLIVTVGVAYTSINIDGQEATYETSVYVNESQENASGIGFDLGEGLSFGEMTEGMNKTRTVNIGAPDKALAEVNSEGNISDGLRYDDHLFVNETEIPIEFIGEEPGYYEGEIHLDIKTAGNRWGELWLELLYQLP